MVRVGRMGVLGPQGTHSEAAAQYLNGMLEMPCTLTEYGEIFEVLEAVSRGEIEAALVPVENSLEGAVNITLDVLARSDELQVLRELVWPVHNQLMAKPDCGEVQRIYSHPQPISQCQAYLRKHYPHAEVVKTASTARAAELVAEEPASSGWAAVCTKRAGELNGLVAIAEEIQDTAENCTRFFLVGRRDSNLLPSRQDKVLIICQIDGKRAGSLCEVLEEFACRSVNMTRIESRPARTGLGEYIFFFDLETDVGEERLLDSIAAVREKCIWLRNLGAFPVINACQLP